MTNLDSQDKELVLDFIFRLENALFYVLATISPGNRDSSLESPGLVGIDKGRVNSSYNQLTILLDKAKELKETLLEADS